MTETRMGRYAPAVAAALVGLGTGLLLIGLTARFEPLLGRTGGHCPVVAAALICLAIGPLIPLRLAVLLGQARPLMRGTARGEVPLMWTTFAAFALWAGLAAALAPVWLPAGLRAGGWVLGRFLWTPSVLPVIQVLVIVALVCLMVTPLGVAASCLHRLSAPDRGWSPLPLGWALLGAALALVLGDWSDTLGCPPAALGLAGSLPILVSAALAAWRAGRCSPAGATADLDRALPELRDHSPILIRLTAAWLAVAAVAVIVLWTQVWPGRVAASPRTGGFDHGCLLAAVGVGLAVRVWSKPTDQPTLGGLGQVCGLSGLALALAVGLPTVWCSPDGANAAPEWMTLAAGMGAVLTLGYALGYAQAVVLCLVGSRAASGALLLAVALAAGAVTLLAVPALDAESPAGFSLLAAVALSLAAVGGTAIIHDPSDSARRRQGRLAAVGLGVGLMICALPIAGRRWARAAGRAQTTRSALPAPCAEAVPPLPG